ncbi:hypothetical protein CVT24_012457 [Panaeolus cyanescens]|uniref:F-box domain-containing protein n=1 Tax=Panaeolus cyanescens TaxID=181874 RepID=A0A409X5X7_9AGAR|nr:hypothetical protein CVT24_012457 [Panaeolus cyanescens]
MGLSNVYCWVSRRLKPQSSPESPESVRKPHHHPFSLKKLKRVFRRSFTRNSGHNPHHDRNAVNENSSATPTSNHDQNHEIPFRHRSLSFHNFSSPLLSFISQKFKSNDDYNNSDTSSTRHIPLSPNVTTSSDIIPSCFSLPISDARHRKNPSHEHAATTADLTATTSNDYDQSNDLDLRTPTPFDDIDSSSPQANAEYHNSDVPTAPQISSSLTSDHTTPLQLSTSTSPPSPSTISDTTQPMTDNLGLPVEVLQLIFWHCISNKAAFDFTSQMQRTICLVSQHWRNIALDDPRFSDVAMFDWRGVRLPFFKSRSLRNIEYIDRMTLHLPASARNAQLDDLQQFISTFLSRCRHVDIHIPKYRVFSDLDPEMSFRAPNASNDDLLHHATPVFDDTTLVQIMGYLQLSQWIQTFSWSSENPLENSLSSFLRADSEETHDFPQTNIEDGNETSDNPPPIPTIIKPATQWPHLSHLL